MLEDLVDEHRRAAYEAHADHGVGCAPCGADAVK